MKLVVTIKKSNKIKIISSIEVISTLLLSIVLFERRDFFIRHPLVIDLKSNALKMTVAQSSDQRLLAI